MSNQPLAISAAGGARRQLVVTWRGVWTQVLALTCPRARPARPAATSQHQRPAAGEDFWALATAPIFLP
jgi:hypothetical protein